MDIESQAEEGEVLLKPPEKHGWNPPRATQRVGLQAALEDSGPKSVQQVSLEEGREGEEEDCQYVKSSFYEEMKKYCLNDNLQAYFNIYQDFPDFKNDTDIVALDVEMVLCEGNINEVVRVAIVNKYGQLLYERIFKPAGQIKNCVTWITGLTKDDFVDKPHFNDHKEEVFRFLRGKTIVGYYVKNDLKMLSFHIYSEKIIDLMEVRFLHKNHRRSLAKIMFQDLCLVIQSGAHNPIEDARAALMIYLAYERKITYEMEMGQKPKK